MKKLVDSHWSSLPHDILWQIIERLDAVDHHCLSAVCRDYRWSCKTDLSRFIPNDQVPWLYIRRSSESSLVELYRPLTGKTYTLDLPKIRDTYCYYTKGGWLLLGGYADYHNLFLFNIFSKEKVCLPSLTPNIQWGYKATFSTHQKQPNCVIVVIHGSPNFSSIYAWTKADTTWKRRDCALGVKSIVCTWLSDDLFYCFTADRCVYNFDKDLEIVGWHQLKAPSNDKWNCITEAMDMTSNIALCNNDLYFYWKERHRSYEFECSTMSKFDCSTMKWTRTDDARDSIWFINTSGCSGGGFMIEGNFTNKNSLVNNLVNKGCKIDTKTFGRRGNIPVIKIASKSVDKGLDYFKYALVTRIDAQGRSMVDIKAGVTDLWSHMNAKVSPLGRGYLLARFEVLNDFQKVKFGGPWYYGKQLLRLSEWTPNFKVECQKHSNAEIWVKFPGLSLEYWEIDILMAMARTVGSPVHVDRNTLKRDNGFYASVLVDIDLSKPVPDRILIEVEDKGIEFWQEIQLGILPKFCNNCKVVGHLTAGCNLLSPIGKEAELKTREGENISKVTLSSKRKKKRQRKRSRENNEATNDDEISSEDEVADEDLMPQQVENLERLSEEEENIENAVEGIVNQASGTIEISSEVEVSQKDEGSNEVLGKHQDLHASEDVQLGVLPDEPEVAVLQIAVEMEAEPVVIAENIQGIEEITEGHLQEPVFPTTSLVIGTGEQEEGSGGDVRFSSPVDVEIVPDSQLEVVEEANMLLNRLKEKSTQDKQEKISNKRQLVAKIGKKKVALLPPGPFKDKCTAAMSPPE